MKVHPYADRFPMMTSDELADLAEDIKANGLKHAIVTGIVGDEEMLIDGRNRLKACEIAKVEPRFEQLNGQDPIAFILSNNIARRHLNAGQRAMMVAFAHPEGEKGGRGKKAIATIKYPGVSPQTLSHARIVLKADENLADRVAHGVEFLSKAYDEVTAKKSDLGADDAKLEWLKAEAPDLAAEVDEGRTSIKDACDAVERRKRQRKEACEETMGQLAKALLFVNPGAGTPQQWAKRVFENFDLTMWPSGRDAPTPRIFRRCADAMTELARLMEGAADGET